MKFFKISLLLFAFSFLSFSIFADAPKGNSKCVEACNAFFSCAKQKNPKLSDTDKKKSDAGCMNTCKKKSAAVIGCYDSNKNSCRGFESCIMNAYNNSPKKTQ